MRVVAGSARGRRLQAPLGTDTRPTSDRVREAVFSTLVSLGAVDGATVGDLFAGTGAMGIEALSRGAASAVFVERHRPALEAIRANLAATGFADRASVVPADVSSWVPTAPALDLVVIDPPYAFDDWSALLSRLEAAVVVVESDRAVELPDGWGLVKVKRYGSTVVTVAERKGNG